MEKYQHQHTETCVWKTYPSGKQSCVTAKNERERAARIAGTLKPSGDPNRHRRQPKDGWESEFGPVPLKSRDRDWYDEVIVRRALNLEPTGRTPYPLEWRAIVNRVDWDRVSIPDLARCTGVSQWYLGNRRQTHAGRY